MRLASSLILSIAATAAFSQFVKLGERILPIDVSGQIPQLGLLSNGKFVASLSDGTGTRIYWCTRNNVVQGLRYLPNIFVSKMIVIADETVVVGRSGFGAGANTFVGRYGTDGIVRWQAVVDGSGILAADEAKDVSIGPGNHLYVSGNVDNGSFVYANCLSLNYATGVLRFRATRTSMDRGANLEATFNGKIHVYGPRYYWRLDMNGVTETVGIQPPGVSISRTRTNGVDIYAVGTKTTSRVVPYLQKRNSLDIVLWERTDPFSIGTTNPGLDNYFNMIKLDGGGAPYVSGMVSNNATQWAHILRYTSAGANTADSWFAQSGGSSYFSGPLALDQYNGVYYSLRNTGASSASIIVYKFDPALTSSPWGMIAQSASPANIGVHFDTVVHPASGDIITLLRDGQSPSNSIWQIWRQKAVPVAETYTVSGSPFNSPFSVLQNDRFKEGAVLELVTTTTKGTLNLNTATGQFQYVKNIGENGQDQFVYRLRKNGLTGLATTVRLNL